MATKNKAKRVSKGEMVGLLAHGCWCCGIGCLPRLKPHHANSDVRCVEIRRAIIAMIKSGRKG